MSEAAVSGAIKFDAFLPVETTVLEITTAAGDATGWKITLGGNSHPKAVAASDAMMRRELRKAKLIEQAQVNGRRYVGDELSPEEQRRENIRPVVARIVDWTPIEIGGVTYPFSDEAAFDLLTRPELGFVLGQVSQALNTDKLFTKGSAKP